MIKYQISYLNKNLNSSFMKHILLFLLMFPALIFAQHKEVDTLPKSPKSLPGFRVGAQVGYAYISAPMLRGTPSALRNSLSFGADLSYFFAQEIGPLKSNLGGGIKYNGTHSENFKTHYLGAFFVGHSFFGKNRHCVFGNVSAGIAGYRNDIEIIKEEIEDFGILFGMHAETGYDFMITPSFAIGIQASFTVGFAKHTIDKFGVLRRKTVSHIDISIGFRFYE